MLRNLLFFCLIILPAFVNAQDAPRSISLPEYEKAKSLDIKDLDNDTYVKFENTYVLDRYESRKPYFITGDDGKKKRIDLYRYLLKDGLVELGTLIFYTNETGKVYKACLPGFRADGKIWEKYFEDIHAIDKVESNFVLKLSYVLSKEFGFQLYKAANQGKDLSKESGTYGSDICFPGNVQVTMADGSSKQMQDIKTGEKIITVDPVTKNAVTVTVNKLVEHEQSNYAITQLTLLHAEELMDNTGTFVALKLKSITATPNHPVLTNLGDKKIGLVKEGESILCFDNHSGKYLPFTVWKKQDGADGKQKVFNIETSTGETFVINEVMVLAKERKQ